uniref:Uncharacterized protein n=1 Tax=Anopheles minimus TaxID=112268 RepID=A0A182WQG4_9DIPT
MVFNALVRRFSGFNRRSLLELVGMTVSGLLKATISGMLGVRMRFGTCTSSEAYEMSTHTALCLKLNQRQRFTLGQLPILLCALNQRRVGPCGRTYYQQRGLSVNATPRCLIACWQGTYVCIGQRD